MEVAQDDQEIIARVAALDIGKAEVVCCVRVPGVGPRARRMQEVRTYTTMTRSLLAMADWLTGLGVTRVVMEATGDYWRPPFYLLENSFETWLVNAKDVKHLPGRPKTDRLDAVWLCKVAERQMLRPVVRAPAGVPGTAGPDPVPGGPDQHPDGGEAAGGKAAGRRADHDVRRGQRHLRGVRAGHDGRAGRRGTRPEGPGADGPRVDAAKTGRLEEAFTGRFTDHHAFLLRTMLARIDGITADIDVVQDRIDEQIAPFAKAVTRLDEIPGVGVTAAQAIIAEVG